MPKPVVPKLWIKLTFPQKAQIGPGKIELLKRIEAEKSISAAARAMDMSYRRAWLLVDELNRMLPAPVVTTHVGGRGRGGAELTEYGRKLVGGYERIVEDAGRACAERLSDLALR